MTVVIWFPVLVMIVGLICWYLGVIPRTPPRHPPLLLGDIGRIFFIIGAFFTVWVFTLGPGANLIFGVHR